MSTALDWSNRTCNECSQVLPVSNGAQSGYYCCDDYYCSDECLDKSLKASGTTWREHYHDDGDCFFTEWWLPE